MIWSVYPARWTDQCRVFGAAPRAAKPTCGAVGRVNGRTDSMVPDAASRTGMQCFDGDTLSCMSIADSRLSDEDLVARLKAGNPAEYNTAWKVLYDRWFPKMRARCRVALGAGCADDVAQDDGWNKTVMKINAIARCNPCPCPKIGT